MSSATRGADTVLMPGFPRTHGDHARLTELLLRKGLNCHRVGLYAEQPYLFTEGKTPVGSALSPSLVPVIGATSTWTRMPAHRVHRRTKFKAVRSYRSQLRHLGLGNIGLHRMLWREAAQGREAITCLS